MNPEVSTQEGGEVEKVSLDQKRILADQIASAKSTGLDPKQLDLRIIALLVEKPEVTVEMFRETWRKYIQEQLKVKDRSFQDIWKSVVDLDLSNREGLGPDIPTDEMYDRLNKAVTQIKGDSPGAVSHIIREVVLEFRPKRRT